MILNRKIQFNKDKIFFLFVLFLFLLLSVLSLTNVYGYDSENITDISNIPINNDTISINNYSDDINNSINDTNTSNINNDTSTVIDDSTHLIEDNSICTTVGSSSQFNSSGVSGAISIAINTGAVVSGSAVIASSYNKNLYNMSYILIIYSPSSSYSIANNQFISIYNDYFNFNYKFNNINNINSINNINNINNVFGLENYVKDKFIFNNFIFQLQDDYMGYNIFGYLNFETFFDSQITNYPFNPGIISDFIFIIGSNNQDSILNIDHRYNNYNSGHVTYNRTHNQISERSYENYSIKFDNIDYNNIFDLLPYENIPESSDTANYDNEYNVVLISSSYFTGKGVESFNKFIKAVSNFNFNKMIISNEFSSIPFFESVDAPILTISFFVAIFIEHHNNGKEHFNHI